MWKSLSLCMASPLHGEMHSQKLVFIIVRFLPPLLKGVLKIFKYQWCQRGGKHGRRAHKSVDILSEI